jgi:hypothetical protein
MHRTKHAHRTSTCVAPPRAGTVSARSGYRRGRMSSGFESRRGHPSATGGAETWVSEQDAARPYGPFGGGESGARNGESSSSSRRTAPCQVADGRVGSGSAARRRAADRGPAAPSRHGVEAVHPEARGRPRRALALPPRRGRRDRPGGGARPAPRPRREAEGAREAASPRCGHGLFRRREREPAPRSPERVRAVAAVLGAVDPASSRRPLPPRQLLLPRRRTGRGRRTADRKPDAARPRITSSSPTGR